MFKSKLQHLCQQRHWPLPEYTSSKDGPDHNPAFSATVIVSGNRFPSSDQSRTSKEAQNNAAKVAFEHLTGVALHVAPHGGSAPKSPSCSDPRTTLGNIGLSSPENGSSSQVKDDKKFIDAPHLFKNRLQSYALKNNLTLPVYSCEREGPPHALRFRCTVTFQGKTIGCSKFYPTIKEAEHAAAKIAWESWSLDEVHQDDSALYKNLLQEYLQKKSYPVPKYEVAISGPPHMPVFVSKVNIQGQVYEGQAALIKKQAESFAAKVAYLGLQDEERKEAEEREEEEERNVSYPKPVEIQPGITSGPQILKALELSSSALQSVIATASDVVPRVTPKTNIIVPTQTCKEHAVEYVASTDEAPVASPESDKSAKRLCLPDSVDFESAAFLSINTNNDHQQGASNDTKNTSDETIVVCPREPNMTCPNGASLLPFSDNKWVAVKNPNRSS